MVKARDLGYRYPDATTYALLDITLDIEPGEYVLLAGQSGSGKSTLLRALNGLVPHFYGGPLVGQLKVAGWDVCSTPTSRLVERVGIVFQNPAAQLFSSTVRRELQFGPASLGLPRDEINRRVEWAAEVTRVTAWLDRPPHALSGGQQQRVAIAAILAMRPTLLALDEPFAHLDAESASRLRAVLRDIHAAGATIIMAEHHLGRLVADATRLIVLHDGGIAADGVPRQVLAGQAVTGLNLPPLVRLARSQGWSTIPLTVDEAIDLTPRPPSLERKGESDPPPLLGEGLQEGTDLTPRPPSLLGKGEKREPSPPPLLGEGPGERSDRGVRESGTPPLLREGLGEGSGRGVRESDPPPLLGEGTGERSGERSAVVAEAVHHRLDGRPALDGLSLRIGAGERVAVVGRNGSGKSTFLRHLNGLLKPHQGRLLVLGQDTRRVAVAALARQVGLVFQDPTKQLFQPTVRREVETGPRALKCLDADWLDNLYARLGLLPLLERSPYRLSEGERRRVALAAALAARPQIAALDEPALGQDGRYREALTTLMDELTADGRTVIWVTHDLDLAAGLPWWLALAEGRLVANGAPEAVMADDQALAVAGLQPTELFEWAHRVRANLKTLPSPTTD